MKLLLIILIIALFTSDSLYAQEKKVKKTDTKAEKNFKTKANPQSKFPLLENSSNQNSVSKKSEELKRKRAETDTLAKQKGIPIRKTLNDGTILILDRFENGQPVYNKIGFVNSSSKNNKNKKRKERR